MSSGAGRSLLAAVAVLFAALSLAVPASASAQGDPVLPDIEMQVPSDIQLTTDGNRSFVAFGAKVINRGPGVLKVVGERRAMPNPDGLMNATQILLDTESVKTGVAVGQLPAGDFQFSPSASHNHWHYLRFEDYNLLKVPSLDVAAPTRKTGFCLLGLNLEFWCGHDHPELDEIGGLPDYSAVTPRPYTEAMGMISETSADAWENGQQIRASEDEYTPTVEGQDIEITNVADGRYCLAFEVNPSRRLLEDRYANNVASRLIDIGTQPNGDRDVDIVAGSFKNSATCGMTKPVDPGPSDPDPPAPGGGGSTPTQPNDPPTTPPGTPVEPVGPSIVLVTFTRSRSSRLALVAVKKAFARPKSVRRSCGVKTVTKAVCRVSFKQGGAEYSGSVTVSQRLRSSGAYWFYSVNVKRRTTGSCHSSKTCPRRVKTKTLMGGALGSNSVAAKRALAAPVAGKAPVYEGAAWPDSALPPAERETVREYTPAGR